MTALLYILTFLFGGFPPFNRRGPLVSFILGIQARRRDYGYGYAAHTWNLHTSGCVAGWKFWDKARHPLRTIRFWWLIKTGRI